MSLRLLDRTNIEHCVRVVRRVRRQIPQRRREFIVQCIIQCVVFFLSGCLIVVVSRQRACVPRAVHVCGMCARARERTASVCRVLPRACICICMRATSYV